MIKSLLFNFYLYFLSFFCSTLLFSAPFADATDEAFTDLGLYGGYVNALAVDPFHPDTLFCAVYAGEGLFRSADGGENWQPLRMGQNAIGEDTFENQSVLDVAVAPGDPDVVWAAHNQWVAKSTDGGNTWTHIRNDTLQGYCRNCSGRSEDRFRFCHTLAIDPDDAQTVYVGTGAPMGAYTSGAIYRTTDGGLTWEKLNNGADLQYPVTDIALPVQRPGEIRVTTSSYGIEGWDGTVFHSENDGVTFAPLAPKPTEGSGLAALAWHPENPDLFFLSGGVRVVRMAFDGTQWKPAVAVEGSGLATEVVFAFSDLQTAYVGWNRPETYDGDGLPRPSISRDSGESWKTVTLNPALASSPNAIAVDPGHPEIVYWGDQGGGVLKSMDFGRTWTAVNQELTGIIVKDVDSDPRQSGHLIAAATGGVYERLDGQWQKRLNRNADSVRFDPTDSAVYYAGLYEQLAKTEDGGRTFDLSSGGINGSIFHIEIDAAAPRRVFIADESHVRRSLDGGDTFTVVLEGVNGAGESHHMNVTAIDPANPQRVLAGGGNFYAPMVVGGLWESLDGGVTWTPADQGLPPTMYGLRSVWGDASGSLYTAGLGGDILRAAQGGIEKMSSGTGENLQAIFGIDSRSIFAVGEVGTILRFDGTDWTAMESPVTATLNGIWGAVGNRLYAVGRDGTIIQYDGAQWSAVTTPSPEGDGFLRQA